MAIIMRKLKRKAAMAARRRDTLSVRPRKSPERAVISMPERAVKMEAEMATPKAAPREEAIL